MFGQDLACREHAVVLTVGLLNNDSSNRWTIRLLFRNQVGKLGQFNDPRVRIASLIVHSGKYRTRPGFHSGFLLSALIEKVKTGYAAIIRR